MRETVDSVLDEMLGVQTATKWKQSMRTKQVTYYTDTTVTGSSIRFCCVAHTESNVPDIMKLFVATDSETLRQHYRIVHKSVQDAKVLSVLEPPTKANPMRSTYLRYTSFEAPTLLTDRDMCAVVATDMFQHTDGSTVGYCLWDSVELPVCPEIPKSSDVIRIRMHHSGYFLQRFPKESFTRIVYVIGGQAGGIAPRLATRFVMDRFGAGLIHMCAHLRRKNVDLAQFVSPDKWKSKAKAQSCHICTRSFCSITRKRHHCKCCGHVICSSCSDKEQVDLPGAGLTSVRMCTRCLEKMGLVHPKRTSVSSKHFTSLPLGPRRVSTGVLDESFVSDCDSAASRSDDGLMHFHHDNHAGAGPPSPTSSVSSGSSMPSSSVMSSSMAKTSLYYRSTLSSQCISRG
ncbi:TPA: hypothetical protein N0F65_009527 [Lagenidium giganteum]|uniref:FYVE-type domain-containing protein n=1 Tax=Lagenidium giganteum TaxID=4803 RepID=A0AAV2YVR0_9STRA|nr:TPA: hypothetical protein N0F65_009527 [Lagenidium giganteum]